jgi:hypothetical protein
MRCPIRVHVGSDCAEPSQACQARRPATTNRPCVRCVTVASVSKVERKSPAQSSGWQRMASTNGISRRAPSVCRFPQQNPPTAAVPAKSRHSRVRVNATGEIAVAQSCRSRGFCGRAEADPQRRPNSGRNSRTLRCHSATVSRAYWRKPPLLSRSPSSEARVRIRSSRRIKIAVDPIAVGIDHRDEDQLKQRRVVATPTKSAPAHRRAVG